LVPIEGRMLDRLRRTEPFGWRSADFRHWRRTLPFDFHLSRRDISDFRHICVGNRKIPLQIKFLGRRRRAVRLSATRQDRDPARLSAGWRLMASNIKAKPHEEQVPENEASETVPDSPLLDLSDAAVKKLIRSAKKRGYVTHDQINSVLPSEEVNSEQ